MKKLLLLVMVMLGLGSAGLAQTSKKATAKPAAAQQVPNETMKQKRTRIVKSRKVDRSAKTATPVITEKTSIFTSAKNN